MPIITFNWEGRVRLTKRVIRKLGLCPDQTFTLLADPNRDLLVLLPPGGKAPDFIYSDNPISDWQYTAVLGTDEKITVPELLRLSLGWERKAHLSMYTRDNCIYIYRKPPKRRKM